MILNGNQRGGARDLAVHLTRPENEHVELHEVRGFVADTLAGALREAEAISRGTRCRQYLYSLSLNPPEAESVSVSAFENAIDRVEAKLGLAGHPRVVIFHEKQGRRHAHCVWSRIDAATMTAVRMSHDRRKLAEVSRELYFEHRWKMPPGLLDPDLRNPLNFDRHEWFKAKPTGKDPRQIKAAFQQCWAASDSGMAFRHALEQRGYYLARGDRRAIVAVGLDGEVYAVARWTGLRTKEVVARVTGSDLLPTVAEAQARTALLVRHKLYSLVTTVRADFAAAANELEARRLAMVERHRQARTELERLHQERQASECRQRASRFRRGLLGLWDRITGKYAKICRINERESEAAEVRDADEMDAVVRTQLAARQELQREMRYTQRVEANHLARLLSRLAPEPRLFLEYRQPVQTTSAILSERDAEDLSRREERGYHCDGALTGSLRPCQPFGLTLPGRESGHRCRVISDRSRPQFSRSGPCLRAPKRSRVRRSLKQ